MFVADYEGKFLRISHYTPSMVADKQDKCTPFECGLRSNLMMQVVLLQERVFKNLVEKTKICEKVRRIERERKKKVRVLTKRSWIQWTASAPSQTG